MLQVVEGEYARMLAGGPAAGEFVKMVFKKTKDGS